MHSKRKIKEAVSSLKDENNKFTESAKDTANLLALFFSSTFVHEPYGPLQEDFYKNCENLIADMNISVTDVKKLLLKVNPSKSPGPDHINPKLLLALAENDQFVNFLY